MKPMNEAAKGMAKAIRYMNEHGWNQGSARGSGGGACIMYALDMVGRPVSRNRHSPEEVALEKVILKAFPHRHKQHGGSIVTGFNDHYDTIYA